MNQQQIIGEFIKTKRREKNLTQEELAQKLNVSNKTVSKWESGKCMPDYSVIESLCEELDITVSELLAAKEIESEKTEEKKTYTLHEIGLLFNEAHQKKHTESSVSKKVKSGLSFGSALAIVISYVHWNSIGWAILHGLMSWIYIIYYLIKY